MTKQFREEEVCPDCSSHIDSCSCADSVDEALAQNIPPDSARCILDSNDPCTKCRICDDDEDEDEFM